MSARPIYLPTDSVSPAVLAAEAMIVAMEGMHHVSGLYFRDDATAAQQRRWEAEKRVRQNLREAARIRTCVFCLDRLEASDDAVTMAGEELHRICALDSWYASASYPTAGDFAEQMDGVG